MSDEALMSAIPGQRHVQVSVSMQTGGCLSLSLETLVVLTEGDTNAEETIRQATKQLLNAIPVKDVDKVEKDVAPDEDDDVVTKEPHPTFIKLVSEISKLNKTLEKQTGGTA